MKIGVIGLGLIGGSIFKNLAVNPKYEVTGISRSVTGVNIYKNYSALKGCEIVFVCTPMSVTLDVLDKLEDFLDLNTIVTDVCSLKGFVSRKIYKYNFIPSHPMAGTENSGWKASFPELFKDAKWVITPPQNQLSEEQEKLEGVITDMGASVVITTPEEHDKAVALISHMPMVVAQALCANIKDNKLAQILASSGFRDTTRLALSNTLMATDMINLNEENIRAGLNFLQENIYKLLNGNYSEQIEKIKDFRQELY